MFTSCIKKLTALTSVGRQGLDGRCGLHPEWSWSDPDPARVLHLRPPLTPWVLSIQAAVGTEPGQVQASRGSPSYLPAHHWSEPITWLHLAAGDSGKRSPAVCPGGGGGKAASAQLCCSSWACSSPSAEQRLRAGPHHPHSPILRWRAPNSSPLPLITWDPR